MPQSISESKTFFGACPHDCPDGCSMLYTVEEEKLVKVKGNPDHPFTKGRLCVKVKDYEKHHYNPDRLTHPLRRSGPKGSGEFEQISWDEALDEIKTRWETIIAEQGVEAILPYGYAGNMGLLNGMGSGDAFFNKLGTSIGEKTFCASSNVTAQLMTVGPTLGTDPESFVHANTIILWGTNTLSTNTHLWPFVLGAKKKGARLIVIDPYRSRTAAQADLHIAPRPGTDGALALAMINIIIEDNLLDEDYVENYTLGFDELKASAAQYSAEKAEEITGIKAEEIKELANEYAKNQPSVIRVGVGMERYPGGGQAIRAVDCLPALVGAWRHVGGGLLQMPVFVPIRFDLLSKPEWIGADTRVINLSTLAEVLNGDTDLKPGIHSLFVWNANPISQAPNSNKIIEGLKREDLFTVVSEQFMTDTARYADLILPATMAAEHNDIVTSWGHFYISLNQKAIDAPGEVISNFELFQRLADRFGFDDERFKITDMALLAESLDWDSPMLAGSSFALLEKEGSIRVNVPSADEYAPHAAGGFPTPSGKCEFSSSLGEEAGFVGGLLRQGLNDRQIGAPIASVPDYIPNQHAGANGKNGNNNYPLQLNSPKSHAFLNSGYANEGHKLRSQGEQFVMVNPSDADTRGLVESDSARVFNDLGEFVADVRVTDDVAAGTVVATFGYWSSMNKAGGAVNALTTSSAIGFAGTPHFYDTGVEVEKHQ
jgi:anaerobic selenocysteine-containing dehydrogenase